MGLPYTPEVAHRNVLASTVFSEAQRDVLRKFDEWLQLTRDVKIATRYAYLARLKTFVQTFWKQKPFDALTKEQLQTYLLQRPKTTVSLDGAAFKIFSSFLDREDLYTSFKSRKHNRNPTEILTDKEIEAMKKSSRTPFEKAVISFLDDSGCRAGELRSIRMKHLEFDKHGAKVTVNGKTGLRTFRLVSCVPALQQFLNHHPKRDEREAWLFYSKSGKVNNQPISAPGVRQMVYRIAKRAKLKKHVHPHMFRHTAATRLARYFTEFELNKRFGWVAGSRMAAVYTSKFAMEKVDDHYLEIMGRAEKAEPRKPEVKNVQCVRCGNENEGSNQFCGVCGLVLDQEKALELERRERMAFEALTLLNDPKIRARLEKMKEE